MIGPASISWAFWALLTLFGVGLSALLSGMENGAYAVNRVRLQLHARRDESTPSVRRARLLSRELNQPQRLLAALLIGNNIGNYLAVIGVSALLASFRLATWEVIAINAGLLTPVLFIFGETIPKDLFRVNADRIMPRFASSLVALRWLLNASLVLPLVRGFGAVLSRIARGADSAQVLTARARLIALLKEGRRHGVLSTTQTAIMSRAENLSQQRVATVMTPWSRIHALGADWQRHRADAMARRLSLTHLPVVDDHGRALGMVKTIDLWLDPSTPIRSLMRPVVCVEADDTLLDAMRTLRTQGSKVALVRKDDAPVGVLFERDLFKPLLSEVSVKSPAVSV